MIIISQFNTRSSVPMWMKKKSELKKNIQKKCDEEWGRVRKPEWKSTKKRAKHSHMPIIVFFTVHQWANCDVLCANSVLNSQWSRFRRLFLLLKCTVSSIGRYVIDLSSIDFFPLFFFLVLFYNELWTGLNETRYHHTYAKCVPVSLHFELAHFSFSLKKKNFDF